MSLFNQNSLWEPVDVNDEIRVSSQPMTPRKTSSMVNHKQLEDWAYRLGSAANEAHDERLQYLESDILDLRDEVLFELHNSATL